MHVYVYIHTHTRIIAGAHEPDTKPVGDGVAQTGQTSLVKTTEDVVNGSRSRPTVDGVNGIAQAGQTHAADAEHVQFQAAPRGELERSRPGVDGVSETGQLQTALRGELERLERKLDHIERANVARLDALEERMNAKMDQLIGMVERLAVCMPNR